MTSRVLLVAARSGVAVTAPALALLVNLSVPQLQHTPGVLFVAAVAVTAWAGGLWPGLVATALSVLALDYFLVPEYHALDFGPSTWVALGVFVAVAVLINSLTEVQRRLNQALRDQDRRRGEFLAVLGHELRNFLNPISTATAVLRMSAGRPDKLEPACALVERQVGNMSRLIGDLLDAARVRQGKVRLTVESLDLTAVVAASAEAARPLIDVRRQHLELAVPTGPLVVRGDRTRLEQVFLNLLTNAAKY